VNGPVLVAAPRFREAELWARRQGLQRTQWRYARQPEQLRGLSQGTVVMVNARRLDQRAAWEAEMSVLRQVGVVGVEASA
jgi:hypothetical protein